MRMLISSMSAGPFPARIRDVGVTIDTSKMPTREPNMTPYEILLSESQERMLVVALRGREAEVEKILTKWDLSAAVIGEVIAEPVYRVTEGDRVVAEFPGNRLVTDCPVYSPEARESEEVIALRGLDVHETAPMVRGTIASAAIAARRRPIGERATRTAPSIAKNA